ncbi:rhomboid family intramembrane serine protease [Candidatus Viridilinea mediisalina]|nr:rhomboid family intramembrane serine protease [Candidatus Viridilinea mediisalina]
MKAYTFNLREDMRTHTVTYTIVLINIIVFTVLNLFPETRNVLLLDPHRVMEAPWTVISVFFSHEMLIHIVLNMGVLLPFGRRLERIVGGGKLLSVYGLCGFLGSLTIIPFADVIQWIGPVVGASAAVYGVVAALSAIEPDKIIMKGAIKHWALALFIGNALLLMIDPTAMIGGPAHAIGLIAGYFLGQWLKPQTFIQREIA